MLFKKNYSTFVENYYIMINKENCQYNFNWNYLGWMQFKNVNSLTQNDWNQDLFVQINRVSANIYKKSGIGGANRILSPIKFKPLFEKLEFYNNTEETLGNKYEIAYLESDENIIYIFNSKALDLDTIKLECHLPWSEAPVYFDLPANYITEQELINYRKTLCGSIEILNFKNNLFDCLTDEQVIDTCLTYKDYKNDCDSNLILDYNQHNIIEGINNNRRTIIKKDRQTGVSTAIQSLISVKLLRPEKVKIIYFTNRHILSFTRESIRKKLLEIITNLGLETTIPTNCFSEIRLSNENSLELKSINTFKKIDKNDITDDTWFIFDEVAFEKSAIEIYSDITKYNKKPKITLISTQNGLDDLFFPIYVLGKKSGYERVETRHTDSGFNKINLNNFSEEQIEREFSGRFIIDDSEKLDSNILTRLCAPLSEEDFTFKDVIDILSSGIMKLATKHIIKKEIKYNGSNY